jgi:anti-sigma factor RsiW
MMDHAEATRRLAAEQYLLGELNESEREEFENHFFACPECSETVEAGAVLVANTRAVFREGARFPDAVAPPWKKWLGLEWGLAPAAALAGCLLMLVVVGYQNMVQIPALLQRGESGALAMAPAIPIRAARAPQALTFSRRKGMLTLTIAHEWEQAYSGYAAEIERSADHRVALKTGIAATPADLSVSVRPEGLEAGLYTLTIYGLREGSTERTAVARVPFALTE